MEKRTLLAVVLSLIVIIGWSYFFQTQPGPRQTPAPTQEIPEAETLKEEKATAVEKTDAPPATVETEKLYPTVFSSKAEDIIVETPLYKAVFSTQGGVIKYWELKNYNPDDTSVMLLKEPGVIPSLSLLFESPDRNLPQKLLYSTSTKGLTLSESGSDKGELVLAYSEEGMVIRKRFVFYRDSYKVDFSLETANTPPFFLTLGTDFGVHNKEQREHKGPVLLVESDREEFDEGIEGSETFTGNLHWIAQEDTYFAAALVPLTPVESVKVWKESESAEIAFKLKPSKHDFILYAGPKEYDRLKELESGLEHLINFGFFSIVAMPLFWALKFLYNIFGNYGWSIIALTILVRIPFIPILHKSQQSMKKMQKIQPLMTEIKEKYKKDPQKMQKEMTALYKKHKVNPIGGCLPMFLQIPVFIALYNVLLTAIELRGAPFAFWITDLAVKDPYYVLPIVMGLSMVLQQKMTPVADPKQAKMMMLMPVIFTFMFLTFPAGLVLYWLVNNALGIIQQYFANKKVEEESA